MLCNNHRVYEEKFLDITCYVAQGLEPRVVNLYTAYFPSAIWKALTPTMPLWRHREFINRSLYYWPRALYRGFTHYVDNRVCDYCGKLNGIEYTECHAHFRDPNAPPPPPHVRRRRRGDPRDHRCSTPLRRAQIVTLTPQQCATRGWYRSKRMHWDGQDADESQPPTRHPEYWHPDIPERPLLPRQTRHRPNPRMQAVQARPPRDPALNIASPFANCCDDAAVDEVLDVD